MIKLFIINFRKYITVCKELTVNINQTIGLWPHNLPPLEWHFMGYKPSHDALNKKYSLLMHGIKLCQAIIIHYECEIRSSTFSRLCLCFMYSLIPQRNIYYSDYRLYCFNSLASESLEVSLQMFSCKLILQNDIFSTSYGTVLRWGQQKVIDGKAPLVQVMHCCRQAPGHHLSQSWPRSMLPYGINVVNLFPAPFSEMYIFSMTPFIKQCWLIVNCSLGQQTPLKNGSKYKHFLPGRCIWRCHLKNVEQVEQYLSILILI